MLCLHGFTGAPDAFEPVLSRLVGHRAVSPVLFGHGPSGDHDVARSFMEEVDRLAALVRTQAGAGAMFTSPSSPGMTGSSRVQAASSGAGAILVGYSLGARFALGLVVRHPGLFARAVLIGGSAGLATENERAARVASDEAWAARLEQNGLAPFADAWAAQPLFASQESLSREGRLREHSRRLSHTSAGLAASLRLHGLGRMPDFSAALPDLDVPCTLVTGELDAKFTALAARQAQAIPGARHVIVPGAGHNVLLERPDAVARAL